MLWMDTKIQTVYDGPQPLKSLLGKEVLVYAWNPQTKLPAIDILEKDYGIDLECPTCVEVAFDSGLKVICTTNHRFYTFRGKLHWALALRHGESIRAFSLSIQKKDGHLRAHGWVDGKTKHQYVARMIWEYYNGPIEHGMILHHRDFNKLNNRLENFELLNNSIHNSVHYPGRREAGFHRRGNHKVESIRGLQEKFPVVAVSTRKLNTLILADEIPVAGVASGVVCAGG